MMKIKNTHPSLGFPVGNTQTKPLQKLSKSKLIAFRQCARRLWLEIHNPNARNDSTATNASFNTGNRVGELARRHYDPAGKGQLIDLNELGLTQTLTLSRQLAERAQTPVFEMGFEAQGVRAFADIMLPVQTEDGRHAWRMVEVKSSTGVKRYHQEDVAIQFYVARQAGVPVQSVALAHINSDWTYPGHNDYDGLLTEVDLTEVASNMEAQVKEWICEASQIVSQETEPIQQTGPHCSDPFECGFRDHCSQSEPKDEHPITLLPRLGAEKAALWKSEGIRELKQVPDDRLNALQQRVKHCTLTGETYFDAKGAAQDLAAYTLPAYFLDFETIAFAVPIWVGTKPYRQIPFQFSLHTVNANGEVKHSAEFLDLSGNDPSRPFAEALIDACATEGPVFVYNAGFETARIKELAERFTDLASALLAINDRVVDLLPIARYRYYHPDQHGSWSIKKVLPTLSKLDYTQLECVQDGGLAQEVYLRAIDPICPEMEKSQIQKQLLAYCKLDTVAMVEIWRKFNTKTST